MALDSIMRRRFLGALFLLAALLMLVLGQTVLKAKLRDVAFLAYWLVCFALTGLAILVAYLDMRSLQHRTRRETRDLLQSTFGNLPPRPEGKSRPSAHNDGN